MRAPSKLKLLGLASAALLSTAILRAAAPESAPAPSVPAPITKASLESRFKDQVTPLLAKNCYRCHGDGKAKGDVTLDTYTDLNSIQKDAKRWKHVSDMVTQKLMPPEDRPPLKPEEVALLASWIKDAVDFYDCTGPRDPGRIGIHRLNRTEYNNTIRELVGVDFRPAEDFPTDDSGYGFDNIAAVLTMSPLLAEKYLAAAEQVMDRAIVTTNPLRKRIQRLEGADLFTNGDHAQDFRAIAEAEYEVRVRASGDQAGSEPPKMTLKVDDKELVTWDVPQHQGRPGVYAQRLRLARGQHKLVASYINNYVNNNDPDPAKRGDRNLYIDSIEVEGPFDAPPPPWSNTQKRIIFCTPDIDLSERDCVTRIFERFTRRAFRRPATKDEVAKLYDLYKLVRSEGDSFEQGVKTTLTAVLVSPHFLFRIEADPPGKSGEIRTLNDWELATRLSYFIWSSMPDSRLFELAEQGKLRDPAVFEEQVRRMLKDSRASELVGNFGGQWLELRNLDSHDPDLRKFRRFNYELKVAMKREVEMFLGNLVREDRSILELIDSDYTFANERLATFYGVKGVAGERFTKISLAGTPRGGVLTMAGVLTVTAMPTRTSPVKRGHFIMEQILGASPPPPPAEIPTLEEQPPEDQNAPLRLRMEKHRKDPNCAVCHVRMDSIGFALENFDAIGSFRESENGQPIDASGSLPEGITFNGAAELKKYLLENKKDFAKALAEKMLVYSLGRGLEPSDRCTVEDVVREIETADYRFSGLVLGIVKSDAFQKRRIP